MFLGHLCIKTGMCLTQGAVMLYMERRPLPSLCDFGDCGFLCTVIVPAAGGIGRCSQLSSPLPEHPLLHQGKAGRRDGSVFYGLRPL
jgi:hypothetical protein